MIDHEEFVSLMNEAAASGNPSPLLAAFDAQAEALAEARRLRAVAEIQRDHAVTHAVKLEESPLRFENIRLMAMRDAALSRAAELEEALREVLEAGREVVRHYDACREANSMAGFWTVLDDLAKAIEKTALRSGADRARRAGAGERGGDQPMKFQLGDEVEWTSQSAGSTRTKRGKVYRVLVAGENPRPMSKNRNPGVARDHESYIVRVTGKGLYWPRVAALRRVERESHDAE